MRPPLAALFVAALACFAGPLLRADDAGGPAKAKTASARQIEFARDIEPILAQRCWSCRVRDWDYNVCIL